MSRGKFFREITKERREREKKRDWKNNLSPPKISSTQGMIKFCYAPLFAEKPSRESITKLNPWFEVVFLSWTTGKSSLFFPPWRDDCSLLARKKFRYRRMTFVLKIASPFLLLLPSRLSIVRDRGYSYVYLNTKYVSLPLSINRFLSLQFPSLFFQRREATTLAPLPRKLNKQVSTLFFYTDSFLLRRENIFQN